MKKLTPYFFLGILALLMYLSFEWAIGAVVHNRQVIMVPDLSGKTVTEALGILSSMHLGLSKEGEQFDKQRPAGTVVRQNPSAGMMVREGRMVRIILSQGGETLFVPDVLGQPLRNAQTVLQNTGLSIGEVERRPSLRYEKDQVVATDPVGGATVSKNTMVNLIVSDGPPGSDVLLAPDFVGKNIREAKSWAASHEVTLTTREEADMNKSQGEILMQAPTGDSPMRSGDTIAVVVNNLNASVDGPHVRYEVPQGASDKDIRILVMDESGEREVYRKSQSPGSRIDFPVSIKGRAKARIFANGIMVDQQELQ